MPRAYLSSTFKDLETHRKAAFEAVLKMGFDCSAMENYVAADDRPVDHCLKDVGRCDLYIGVFAHRYGFVPPGHDRSITELEYLAARDAGKPALLFFVHEDHPWPPRFVDGGPAAENVAELRQALMTAHTVATFTTPEDLALKVSAALSQRILAAAAGPAAPPGLLPASNLPADGDTPFIGRDTVVTHLVRLFRADAGLVTVTGTGGIGKTRLACAVARELLADFGGRCFFADLAEQQTETGVSNAVAESIGRRLEQKGEPGRVLAEMLAVLPPMLVVLDNFEQVVRHAAATVAHWRGRAPAVRFLVTSRTVLGVGGRDYRLASLDAPAADAGLDALRHNEAVQLFVDRAARRKTGFGLTAGNAADVVALCRKLECLPLSLVLVAERVKDYPPHQLLDRLGRRFALVKSDRDSLWKTIEWSYQLLEPHEQQAFVQACVFVNGFTLDAAEAVLRPAGLPPQTELMDVVQSLCDHSLVNSAERHDEARFDMLVSLLEFGQEMWPNRTAPPDLARRWTDYYLDYSLRLDAAVQTPRCREALDRLVDERENVLSAHAWALQAGDPVRAAKLILAYARALEFRGPWNLRLPRLTDTFERLGDGDPPLRTRLAIEMSKAYWGVGKYEEAHDYAHLAAKQAEASGDDILRASALRQLGSACNDLGRRDEAKSCYEGSIALCRAAGDAAGVALNQIGFGNVLDRVGRQAEALAMLTAAVGAFEDLGSPMDLANALNVKGMALWHEGRPADALPCYEEAERISREQGDVRRVAGRLTNRGLSLAELDRFDEALACCAEAERLHLSQGNRSWNAVNLVARGQALFLRGDAAAACECLATALRVSEETKYRENEAFAAGCLGRALFALGRVAEAHAALNQAVTIQHEIDKAQNRRYWGNLIQLARAEKALGRPVADKVAEALALAERLGLRPDHPLRVIRQDWQDLTNLQQEGPP